jgi:hypothetical protein
MATATDTIQPAARPWYRLHLSTCLLLAPVVAVLVLLNVPDDVTTDWTRSLDGEMVHGFPATYLRREREWYFYKGLAKPLNPWNLTDRVASFWARALAADVVFAIGIVVLLAAIFERRRRRRKLYQFTLGELLALTALLAVGLYWWSLQRDKESRLLQIVNVLRQGQHAADGLINFRLVPRVPRWIRDIVGDERLRGLKVNSPEYLDMEWDPSIRADVEYLGKHFPDSLEVAVTGEDLQNNGNSMAALSPLGSLTIVSPGDDSLSKLQVFARLESLNIGSESFGSSHVTDRGLANVAGMTHLESLSVSGEFTAEGMTALRPLRALRCLVFFKGAIAGDGLRNLEDLDQLEELVIRRCKISDGSLEELKRLKKLRRISFDWVALSAQNLNQLSALPNLERAFITLPWPQQSYRDPKQRKADSDNWRIALRELRVAHPDWKIDAGEGLRLHFPSP